MAQVRPASDMCWISAEESFSLHRTPNEADANKDVPFPRHELRSLQKDGNLRESLHIAMARHCQIRKSLLNLSVFAASETSDKTRNDAVSHG
jgi:hypothetical protein